MYSDAQMNILSVMHKSHKLVIMNGDIIFMKGDPEHMDKTVLHSYLKQSF